MSSGLTPKTIALRGDPLGSEAQGLGAITPGMLLAVNAAGQVIPHNVASGVCGALFAREEEYVGGGIDTPYASLDRVAYWCFRPGDWVYALLEDEQNVAVGAYLESNGAGALQPLTVGTFPIARALEAVSTVGGAVAVARIKVEII